MMLDISRNDAITTIPNEFGQLRNLFSFRVDGLNQLQIPKDLRPTDGKNVRPMLDFLSQRLRKQVPHSFLKVFMAGKSSTTKNAVLQALDPDKFRQVSSKHDQLDVKNFTIGHINITLWDLPFDNMYSTQPFFMCRDRPRLHQASLSEWLRSLTRNQMGSARTGSNPVARALFSSLVSHIQLCRY